MCPLISYIMLQLTCHRSITTALIGQLISALYRDYEQYSSDVKLYSELEQLARRKVLTSLSESVLTKPYGTCTRTCQTHFHSCYTWSGDRKFSKLPVKVHKHLVWNDREIANNPSFLENKNPGFILQTWDTHNERTAGTNLTLYKQHTIRLCLHHWCPIWKGVNFNSNVLLFLYSSLNLHHMFLAQWLFSVVSSRYTTRHLL